MEQKPNGEKQQISMGKRSVGCSNEFPLFYRVKVAPFDNHHHITLTLHCIEIEREKKDKK